jgi:hypothetical protein
LKCGSGSLPYYSSQIQRNFIINVQNFIILNDLNPFDTIFFSNGHNNVQIAFGSVITVVSHLDSNERCTHELILAEVSFLGIQWFNPRLPRFSVDIGQVRVEYRRSYPTLKVTASHFFI